MHRRRAHHWSPFLSRRVTFNAQTVARYFPALSLPLTSCGHTPGTAVHAVAASHTRTDHITGEGTGTSVQNLSQVVHTSNTTPPAHPNALPPDATSYHQALSMHQIPYDVHLTRTRKKASHGHMLRWSIRLHAINSCSSEGTGARRGERAQRLRHQQHSTTLSYRQSFGWLSSQRTTRSVGGQPSGNVSGLHRLTGHHSHARRGPTVLSGGTNIRCCTTRTVGPTARARVRSHKCRCFPPRAEASATQLQAIQKHNDQFPGSGARAAGPFLSAHDESCWTS